MNFKNGYRSTSQNICSKRSLLSVIFYAKTFFHCVSMEDLLHKLSLLFVVACFFVFHFCV